MNRPMMHSKSLPGLVLLALLAACSVPEISSRPVTALPDQEEAKAVALAGVDSNDRWKPTIEERQGVPMALVPAGCFMMGSTGEQIEYIMGFDSSTEPRSWFDNQQPVHEVCFEAPFWIDVHEVSQAQFTEFDGQADKDSVFVGAERPRESVSWFEADAFCRKRGARLPTEAEWEYAARGPDGLVFPWGNKFDCAQGNFDDETEAEDPGVIDGYPNCDGYPTTSPVGALPGGASWVGALDLSGNVWEWVADRHAEDYYQTLGERTVDPQGPTTGALRGLRGGAWSMGEADHLPAAFRAGYDPSAAMEHLGFRCALTLADS